MDEKWNTTVSSAASDGSYEGFDPQRQGDVLTQGNNNGATNQSGQYTMVNVGSSSFASIVTGAGRETGAVTPSNYQCGMEENQENQENPETQDNNEQTSNPEVPLAEDDQDNLCFTCSTPVVDSAFEYLKTTMNHSHAPLLVLMSDVLGYKFEDTTLHSKVICKSCYHLLDIIDELEQTLTESKTEVRTKFLDTLQRFKLKYPRTDKMIKPRCTRCAQLPDTPPRKRSRGRGRNDDRRVGRGRGRPRADDGDDHDSSVTLMEVEPDINVDDDDGQGAPSKPAAPAHEYVFDDDPEIFSPDEKLKVGIILGEEGNKSYCCMYCRNSCDAARALKTHVRVYHMPILVYDNGQGASDTRYRMGIKLQNTTPNDIVTTEKPFACLFCECAYKLQSSLQSHFRSHHSPHKPFQCAECKESFRMPIELSRHRLYRCQTQKRPFSNNKKSKHAHL